MRLEILRESKRAVGSVSWVQSSQASDFGSHAQADFSGSILREREREAEGRRVHDRRTSTCLGQQQIALPPTDSTTISGNAN